MLPTVIYLLEALRRALKKSGRGLFIVADIFREAMHDWRARSASIRSASSNARFLQQGFARPPTGMRPKMPIGSARK